MLDDLEAELVLHGDLDRLAPLAGDVEVRRLAAGAVPHGVDVVGRVRAEDRDGDRDAEDHPEQRVGEVVDPEVDAEERGRDQHGGAHELRLHPRPPRHHEHVDGAGDHDGESRHRYGRGRVALPVADDRDAEGSGSRRQEEQPFHREPHDRHADQVEREMPPAPEPCHGGERGQTDEGEPEARADRVQVPRQAVEPLRAQRDDGIGDGAIEAVERPRVDVQPDAPRDDDDEHQGKPEDTGRPDRLGQRWRRPGGSPVALGDLAYIDDVFVVRHACTLIHGRIPPER